MSIVKWDSRDCSIGVYSTRKGQTKIGAHLSGPFVAELLVDSPEAIDYLRRGLEGALLGAREEPV